MIDGSVGYAKTVKMASWFPSKFENWVCWLGTVNTLQACNI